MADELYHTELESTLAAWEAESKLKIAKLQARGRGQGGGQGGRGRAGGRTGQGRARPGGVCGGC